MTGRARGWLAVGAGALLLLGCGGGDEPEVGAGGTSASTTTGPGGSLQLTVLGDSIPFNAPEDCPECTGFVSQFVEVAADATGRQIRVDSYSRHDSAGVGEVRAQLDDDAQLSSSIAEADIVLLSVGTFDMPPWPAGMPCGGDAPGPGQIAAQVLAYTPACIDEAIATFHEDLAEITSVIAGLRAGEPSVLIVLTVYDVFLDDPRFASLDPAQRPTFDSNLVLVHDRWNESACSIATGDGFVCVDVYGAFNGPDGRTPVGDKVVADHIHPSQAGNDVIADLLSEVDLGALSG